MIEKMKLEVTKRKYVGYRVTNTHGEAELGTYHIADFAWKEHADMFVNIINSMNTKEYIKD